MKELATLVEEYPQYLRTRGENILREYLQHEILHIIFTSKYAHQLTFLGGTCVRLIYGSERFSEDLDFDSKGLAKQDFEALAGIIKTQLELLGYEVNLKFVFKGAFHCSIKFPGLLYHHELSGHKEAVLFIKLDAENQHFAHSAILVPLQKFGITTEILAVPKDLLCAQKIAAIMGRKRPKGRDYYDLHFLLQSASPNYDYLTKRFGVSDAPSLKKLVNDRIATFDFGALAKDVRPFVFRPQLAEVVRDFPEFWDRTVL
ncbi:MAG: nucleotidyl transferase AbiEii/AbiGii toxin family protein [Bacteroidota bacterium]